MHTKLLFSATVLLTSIFAVSRVWANTCSKEDIDYYLQRGFSHEQVVKLCSNTPVMRQNPATQGSPTTAPVQTNQSTATPANITTPTPVAKETSPADLLYFKTVIESDQVDLTTDALSYSFSGCIKYGEEDIAGFREEACVNTLTTIKRKGLQVIKAQKGIFLVRDNALIIAAEIKREVLDADNLKSKKRKAFLAEYALNPGQLNIPLRSGIDPHDVAARLQLIAK